MVERWSPLHFEIRFGSSRSETTREPHTTEPLAIDLGDGRQLRVSGKIDRIDAEPDGSLVLRDYKTGRAPKDDGGMFRGGRELQIPIYVLAARMLFPGRRVAAAFLDYVNGGRPVAFDPDAIAGDEFRSLLKEMVDAMGAGGFVQEPASCRFCDFGSVCGPQALIEIRRGRKAGDPRVRRYATLRSYR
jgi:ATP-dependent helicase/DNAse subunit B